MIVFRRTDLPVPDGPRMAVIAPLGTSNVMPSSTVCSPKDLLTPRRETMALELSPFPCSCRLVALVTPRERRGRPGLAAGSAEKAERPGRAGGRGARQRREG